MATRRSKQQRQEQVVFFTTERILRWMRWYHRKRDTHPELTRYERNRMPAKASAMRAFARRLNDQLMWRKSHQSSSF